MNGKIPILPPARDDKPSLIGPLKIISSLSGVRPADPQARYWDRNCLRTPKPRRPPLQVPAAMDHAWFWHYPRSLLLHNVDDARKGLKCGRIHLTKSQGICRLAFAGKEAATAGPASPSQATWIMAPQRVILKHHKPDQKAHHPWVKGNCGHASAEALRPEASASPRQSAKRGSLPHPWLSTGEPYAAGCSEATGKS
jgi:hypothetical protein